MYRVRARSFRVRLPDRRVVFGRHHGCRSNRGLWSIRKKTLRETAVRRNNRALWSARRRTAAGFLGFPQQSGAVERRSAFCPSRRGKRKGKRQFRGLSIRRASCWRLASPPSALHSARLLRKTIEPAALGRLSLHSARLWRCLNPTRSTALDSGDPRTPFGFWMESLIERWRTAGRPTEPKIRRPATCDKRPGHLLHALWNGGSAYWIPSSCGM